MVEYLNYWLRKTADETPNDMELGDKLRKMLWQTDNKGQEKTKEWIVEQYNRNRSPKDWVERVEEMPGYNNEIKKRNITPKGE